MSARRRMVDPIETKALAVDVVQRLGQRRRALDDETVEVLQFAYASGVVTWTDLGAALGVTGSVAWHLAHPAGTAEPDTWEVPAST